MIAPAGIGPTSGNNEAVNCLKWLGEIAWLLVLFVIFAFPVKAQTIVSGPIASGTWRPAGNPYTLLANATLPAANSLTVEPGVQIIIPQGVRLELIGKAVFSGTKSSPIVIGTGVGPKGGSVQVLSNVQETRFEHCQFRNSETGLYLQCKEGVLRTVVQNCTFENCDVGLLGVSEGYVYGRGIGQSCVWTQPQLNPVIANCTFVGGQTGAIFRTTGLSQNCNSLSPGTAFGSASPEIRNCIFRDLGSIAIQHIPLNYTGTSKPVIENNTFFNCSQAIAVPAPVDAFICNNIFASNRVSIARSGTASASVVQNCFYQSATNFLGYASFFGQVITTNRNGTAVDIASNMFENPGFENSAAGDVFGLKLSNSSPCIDAGRYDFGRRDFCNLPGEVSGGTDLTDLGAFGGPGACNWINPVPLKAAILQVERVGTNLNVHWVGIPGQAQQMLLSSNLSLNTWMRATTTSHVSVTATNAFVLPMSYPKAYLRTESLR